MKRTLLITILLYPLSGCFGLLGGGGNKFRVISTDESGEQTIAIDNLGLQTTVDPDTKQYRATDDTMYELVHYKTAYSGHSYATIKKLEKPTPLESSIAEADAQVSVFRLAEKESLDNGYDYYYSYYGSKTLEKKIAYYGEFTVGDSTYSCASSGYGRSIERMKSWRNVCRSLAPLSAPKTAPPSH